MFDVEPLTPECAEVLSGAPHVCIGVSPFNSYFSTERLVALASWALSRFAGCHFFVPDDVSAYTLEALGYQRNRAHGKARRQGCYVRNKIVTVLETIGMTDPERLVVTTSELAGNTRYRELHQWMCALFDADPAFRSACLEASSWVLDRRLPPGTSPQDWQALLAVRYLLAELPLFLDTAGIVSGAPGSLFVYHQRVRFLERLYRHEFACCPVAGQGFLVVRQEQPVEVGAR